MGTIYFGNFGVSKLTRIYLYGRFTPWMIKQNKQNITP